MFFDSNSTGAGYSYISFNHSGKFNVNGRFSIGSESLTGFNGIGLVAGQALSIHTIAKLPLHLGTDKKTRLFIDQFRLIGIGTITPKSKLDVNGNINISGKVTIGNVQSSDSTKPTLSTGYSLYVEKGVLAEKVKCAVKNTANWSDHVFNSDYQLPDFYTLEKFIKENKHLPNVPSAEEVVREGIDVAAMDARLLEKIEELTLYMIQLKKENDELRKLIIKQ